LFRFHILIVFVNFNDTGLSAFSWMLKKIASFS
jgi:hypothetical protein